jgi:cytochrome c2
MNSLLKSASALAIVAMVAACGGGGGEAEQDTVNPDETVADEVTLPATMPTPGETLGVTESPAAGETPAPTATPTSAAASPSPTASPTPAATRAAAAATPVAAASPPAMFAVCGACHSVTPGDHGIGPSLAGVFGDRAGRQPGFDYSEPMKTSGLTWNEATLNRFLENPREVVPGTTMAYAGLKNATQRQAVIDYLKTL